DVFGCLRVGTGIGCRDFEARIGSLDGVREVRASWDARDVAIASKFLERGVLTIRCKIAALGVGESEEVIPGGSYVDGCLRSRAVSGDRRRLPGVDVSARCDNGDQYDESKSTSHGLSVATGRPSQPIFSHERGLALPRDHPHVSTVLRINPTDSVQKEGTRLARGEQRQSGRRK